MDDSKKEGCRYLSGVLVVIGVIAVMGMNLACGLISLGCWLVAFILACLSRPKFIPPDDDPTFATWVASTKER